MAGMIKYLQSFRFKGLTVILGVFLAISVVLWTERSGIQYQAEIKKNAYLDRDTVVTETQAVKNIESSCLVLMDSSQADSVVAWEEFERIFMDMKTGVDLADIRQSEIPDFSGYETIVVLMSDLNPLKDVVIKIGNWVEKGGRVLFALTLQKDTYVSLIEQKLGITDSDYGNVLVDKIYIDDDFMIGGGRSFQIPDAYDSAWEVSVGETAKVYAWTDDEKKVPLIWENSYGKGTVYYLGTQPEDCAFTRMMDCIVKEAAVKSLVDERTSLEVTVRKTKENTFYFLINFSKEETVVPQCFAGMQNLLTGETVSRQEILKPFEVEIIKK